MPRKIRVGDQVQAFLDANILGEVIEITTTGNNNWTVAGTSSSLTEMCRVMLKKTQKVVVVKKSELFIVDY